MIQTIKFKDSELDQGRSHSNLQDGVLMSDEDLDQTSFTDHSSPFTLSSINRIRDSTATRTSFR